MRDLLTTCLVVAGIAMSAGVSQAAITNCTLSGDAAAQTRLMAYEASKQTLQAPVEGLKADQVTDNRVRPDDLTAYEPYDLKHFSKERLLDWTTWPAQKMTFGDRQFEFIGLHLVEKQLQASAKPPCIKIAFHIFAPKYENNAGVGVLLDTWEAGKKQEIRLSDATAQTSNPLAVAAGNTSGRFYVIDLARLRQSPYWQKRYDLFKKNIENASSPASYGTHFERFLMNVIRASRYRPPKMTDDERNGYLAWIQIALKTKGVDCKADPGNLACVLNVAFTQTELGSIHPLRVTDALDNSGLAFGPRQVDLGQQSQDATVFARSCLTDDSDVEDKLSTRFFKPIEQLNPRDLRDLYLAVIPTFNERLVDSTCAEEVIDTYVAALITMVQADYGLGKFRFTGDAADFAKVLAADFSNKWGSGGVVAVRNAMDKTPAYDICGFMNGWRSQVRKLYGPNDREDFDRRSGHVLRAFAQGRGIPVPACGSGQAVVTSPAP